MVSKIRSLGIRGIGGYEVSVECFLSSGLPSFDIVGLPDAAVKEARDRVRAAIKNAGLQFPVSHLTINLAPADTKKGGTTYDLPVLMAILSAKGEIKQPNEDCAFFGELSLAGELRPVRGALPMALAAERAGIKQLFVPEDNAPEASFAQGLEVFPLKSVLQLLRHLSGEELISPHSRRSLSRKRDTQRIFQRLRDRKMSSVRWRLQPPGDTMFCWLAHRERENPCWQSACRRFCPI